MKKIRQLLLFYWFSLLNESTVLQEMFGTFFKTPTPSSALSKSSLTHFSSFLFAFLKSVPYCWNSPGSFKGTWFEASKTSCFFWYSVAKNHWKHFPIVRQYLHFSKSHISKISCLNLPAKCSPWIRQTVLSSLRQCKLQNWKPPCLRRDSKEQPDSLLVQTWLRQPFFQENGRSYSLLSK